MFASNRKINFRICRWFLKISLKKRNFEHKKSPKRAFKSGERGIRTLDRVAPIPAFQAGPFNHSGTSPLFELAKIEKIQGSCQWSLSHQTKYQETDRKIDE